MLKKNITRYIFEYGDLFAMFINDYGYSEFEETEKIFTPDKPRGY